MSKCKLHLLSRTWQDVPRLELWASSCTIHTSLGRWMSLKTRLKQTFEPPRAEFRARSELLKIRQGKRDVHAYSQHIRLLASSITTEPVNEQTLIMLFMQGLVDDPIKTHLFRVELRFLEEATAVAEQRNFSFR